ncbi:MAG TPA: Rieske 2Fe-2S domain-containing protein, partial [Spirochaetia bacterium]|nr:Rieske 2Fe-2S domain-containing protein [Spirochaetia bacterium]
MMAESGWKRIISDAELPDGKPVVATLDGEELLLFKRGATLFACGNKCSHYGGPLAEGLVVGDAVI